MKSLLIVLCFFALAYGEGPQNNLREDLLAYLNTWLKGANVITLPQLEGTYKDYGTKLSYSTSEMKLTGLPNSYIDKLVITKQSETALTVTGALIAPSLMVTAEKYQFDGRAFYFYPLKGEGEMWINLQYVVVLFDVEVETNGTNVWVKKLQFSVDVDKIQINLTGTSSILVKSLNSKAKSLFAEQREYIENNIREMALPVINSYLANKTPSQLFPAVARAGAEQLYVFTK